ncbi:hypothetical protein U1Q18_017906, partial [Sarracenia purpurea var. burkii]
MGPAAEQGRASLVFPKRSEVKRGNEIEVGKTVKSFDSSYEAVSKVQTEDEIDLGKTMLKSGFASEVQSDSDVEGGGNGDCGDGQPTKHLEGLHDKVHAASMGHLLADPNRPKSWANIVTNDNALK